MSVLPRTTGVRLAVAAAVSIAALAVAGGGPAGATPGATARPALRVTSSQAVPQSGTAAVVTAEAADGDIAIAVSPSSASDVIEVATLGHAPHALITVPHGTRAMAFGRHALFIAGPHAMSAVNRATGAVIRTWQVRVPDFGPSAHVMAYGDGRLWLLGTEGHGPKVFEINPSSAEVRTIATGHDVGTVVAGPRGGYFVKGGGHTIVRVRPNGHTVTAPTHETVNETLSGPDAVSVTAVDRNELIVAHDAGQGFDSDIVRYNATTLAHLSDAGTDVAHSQVVPTHSGTLVLLAGPDDGGCTADRACVAEISTTTAKTSHALRLPKGQPSSVLLGPDPAVVLTHGHHEVVLRIS